MTKRLIAIAALSLLAACAKSREVNAVSAAEVACTSCHGDPARAGDALLQAAPPASPSGGGGGAHLVHLQNGVACGDCHVVPTSSSHMNGVVDVTFAGTAIANGASPQFTGGQGGSCSGVYCHGATLGGGKVAAPVWSGGPLACDACHGAPPASHAAGSTACSTCHPATVNADGTIVAGGKHMNGSIEAVGHQAGWSNPAVHGPAAMVGLGGCRSCHGQALDGVGGTGGPSCQTCHYDNWQSNCTFCHGSLQTTYTAADLTKAAPPQGTKGETSPTTRAVGAHQKHLTGGALGPAVTCQTCHVVPSSLSHVTGAAATVTFGADAKRGGANGAAWDGAKCSNTYCHGATLQGGLKTAPTWTAGSGETACGSCHGVPPPSHAAGSTTCSTCHGADYSTTTVNATLHMNGAIDATQQHMTGWADKAQHGYAANRQGLPYCAGCHGTDFAGGTSGVSCNDCHTTKGFADWKTNCTFCHGARVATYTSADLAKTAPPVGTEGETDPSTRAVGAHQKHLTGGSIGPAVTCDTCHAVPADLTHVTGTPLVTFGPAAKIGNVNPTWNGSSCGTTYCHGGTGKLQGGLDPTPVWTAGSSQTTCGSCHGLPPPNHSAAWTTCSTCHGTGYSTTTVYRPIHMNGVVDVVNVTCTTCHGKSGQTATAASPLNAAPPVDTTGASSGGLRIGAHQAHLVAGPYTNGFSCQTCHAAVGTYTITHQSGAADVGFTGAAAANLRKGTYVPRSGTTAASCSATWCHGAVISKAGGTSGGTATAPRWTDTVSACTSCHAVSGSSLPNKHPDHSSKTVCGDCHPGYTSSAVNLATHVDGTKQVGNKITTWNGTSCSGVDNSTGGCHGGGRTW